MLVAVIKQPSFSLAEGEMQKAKLITDAFEWRLDHFQDLDLDQLKKLQRTTTRPIIFTLRKESQGGLFSGSEKKRLKILESLASLEPEYIDLEYDIASESIQKIKDISPKTQLIISYHDFTKMPKDLFALLEKIRKPFLAIYKIACKAESTEDLLRLMHFVKKTSPEQRLVGIAMGECGLPSRVLGPIMGNAFDYATYTKEDTELFQLSLQELHEIYRYDRLHSKTEIVALLGDPVDKSAGHIFHNRIFFEKKIDAVYVKLLLRKEEISSFFQGIKGLPFRGFSVTMPLKEELFPFLDSADLDARRIGTVNTIALKEGKCIGYNTDGEGALDALERDEKVRGKRMLILGAGGAAKAIAYEAIKRGAHVIVVNRNAKKAMELKKQLGCEGYGLSALPEIVHTSYDILVNATSVGMQKDQLPLADEYIIANTIVMDVVYHPTNTALLRLAKEKGCICIYGYEMFQNQALLQQNIWF